MKLERGTVLAHYRLVEKIGEGGMGVVWSAEDAKLGRQVAVKILPVEFARDTQRLARFEREAKLLASLNHPNVASIHGFEHIDDVHFLVLELVPGPTLAGMVKAGPLPMDEALDICRQVAEGLEAAHEAGVIHRDLKPGNVKVTPDGKVKVLDFGLAKGLEGTVGGASGPDLSLSPTATVGGTQAGVVLGTAPYMSPEQARGKPLDERTDIWSFGCLLWECLTGRILFTGETVTDVLSAILQVEPDWSKLPARTPPRIRELLARCLERSPRGRLHHIADARIEIERAAAGREWTTSGMAVAEAASGPAAHARKGRLPGGWAGLAAGLALGAVATFLAMQLAAPQPPPVQVRKFIVPTAGLPGLPRLSPDGSRLAWIEDEKLWVRRLDEIDGRAVAGAEGCTLYAWSPDGSSFAISKGGKLWRLPAAGGQPIMLCDLPESLVLSKGAGIAWGGDGRVAFNLGSGGILAVPQQGGQAASIIEPGEHEMDFHNVEPLPGGRGYTFIVHRDEGIDTIAAVTPEGRKDLITVAGQFLAGNAWSPSGHLITRRFPDNPGLWAIPFSAERLEVTGDPFPMTPSPFYANAASDGTLTYIRPAPPRSTRLVLLDRKGLTVATIGDEQEEQSFPSLSPDGSRVAVRAAERGNGDIWIHEMDSGIKRRVTFEETQENDPAWSPSGEDLFYAHQPSDTRIPVIMATSTDGSGRSREITPGVTPSLSRDGRFIVYSAPDEQLDRDIWYLDLKEGAEPVELLEIDGDFRPRFSPDSRYVVFCSSVSGRDEIYITRFPEGQGRWQVSTAGGTHPIWSRDGRRIFYLQGEDLMEVTLASGATPSPGQPRRLFRWESATRGYDVTADGSRFVMVQETDPKAPGSQIVVVQNWAAEYAAAGR
jgi:Tol biopolymer transport system component